MRVFNEIGPAINSAQSIFFFGYPGNGKTSIAERITRLMGDAIYVPHTVEVNGQIVRVFDPILHTPIVERGRGGREHDDDPQEGDGGTTGGSSRSAGRRSWSGGELTMPMLDLKLQHDRQVLRSSRSK